MKVQIARSRAFVAKAVRKLGRVFAELARPTATEVALSKAPAHVKDIGLPGRVVLITGSTRGVGLAIAKDFAQRGAKVVINGRDAARVLEVVAEIEKAGATAIGAPGDVATEAGAQAVVRAAEAHGGLDVLINNAGNNAGGGKPAWDIAPQEFAEVIAANVVGPFLCAREALRAWKARGATGRIVNVSSGAGVRAFEKMAAYGTSKFGLEGLTQYLAADLAGSGIAVTALQLGSVKSEMTRQAFGWAAHELLPGPETLVPAFLFVATAPAEQVHGRSFAAPRLLLDAAAEGVLASPIAAVPDLAFPPLVLDGKPIARDPGLLTLLDRAENQLGLSPRVTQALSACAADTPVTRYPDEHYGALRGQLGHELSLGPECFAIGNGSSVVLDEILRLFCKPGEEAVSNGPGWFGFHMLCGKSGVDNRRVPMLMRPDEAASPHNLAQVLRAIGPRTRLVYLISPSNPEGFVLKEHDFASFMAQLPPTLPVIVDEAYAEYSTDETMVDTRAWSQKPDRIVIGLRTFSKFFGLAGLRVGYAYARPDVARFINRQALLFNVSRMAEAAAVAALADHEHRETVLRTFSGERTRIFDALRSLGLEVYPSQGPFMLFKPPCPAHELLDTFLRAGVVMPPFEYHEARYMMFPIGNPRQNGVTLGIVEQLVKAGRPAA